MIVLTLNGGSSSFKFGLYRADDVAVEALMTGQADAGGLSARMGHRELPAAKPLTDASPEAELRAIEQLLRDAHLPAPKAIGHRIVHGGPKLQSHCLIDDTVLAELDRARALSPLHAPTALAAIARARSIWPDLPQIACFDTVFHAQMPEIARTLPIPHQLEKEGLRRYGFHGLSCESIVHQLGHSLPSRTIVAHLGNGASVTAVRDGSSADTSMGLTPSGGVIMGTRSGDIDPGILVYLAREKGYDAASLEQLVDHRSGLLGVSDLSSDMRELHGAAGNARAQLAIEMFCRSVAKQIAAMIAVLDGADMIVFTGGIGENDASVRAEICAHLAWIGIEIDQEANRRSKVHIDRLTSRASVLCLSSQEGMQIARHAARLLG